VARAAVEGAVAFGAAAPDMQRILRGPHDESALRRAARVLELVKHTAGEDVAA
jgi:hypothetical protein